jgi:hypothetical protein
VTPEAIEELFKIEKDFWVAETDEFRRVCERVHAQGDLRSNRGFEEAIEREGVRQPLELVSNFFSFFVKIKYI